MIRSSDGNVLSAIDEVVLVGSLLMKMELEVGRCVVQRRLRLLHAQGYPRLAV
jgi:hypothetical protein